MKRIVIITLALLVSSVLGCSSSHNPPSTATHVNLKRYMGKWYEIASFPNHFQKDCRCTYAQYTLVGDYVSVLNRCIKGHNKNFSTAKGKAWAPNKNDFSKLKVQFFWPFRGDYWILYLSPDYTNVLVGSPNRKYLWILARKPQMSNTTYKKLIVIAQQKGYDIKKLIKTKQNCLTKR